MTRKKIIIAAACLVLCVLLAVLLLVLRPFGKDAAQTDNVNSNESNTNISVMNVDNQNETPPSNGNADNANISISDMPSNAADGFKFENVANPESQERVQQILDNSQYELPEDANQDIAAPVDDGTTSPFTEDRWNAETPWEVTPPDSQRAKETAFNFIAGFYNYDQQSLNNNSYSSSFTSLLAPSAFEEDTSPLIAQHGDRRWQSAVATYPQIYSHVEGMTTGEPTVSRFTHEDALSVPVELFVTRNQGTPGDMEWDRLVTYKITLAVYLDSDYRVFDVREQMSEAQRW